MSWTWDLLSFGLSHFLSQVSRAVYWCRFFQSNGIWLFSTKICLFVPLFFISYLPIKPASQQAMPISAIPDLKTSHFCTFRGGISVRPAHSWSMKYQSSTESYLTGCWQCCRQKCQFAASGAVCPTSGSEVCKVGKAANFSDGHHWGREYWAKKLELCFSSPLPLQLVL